MQPEWILFQKWVCTSFNKEWLTAFRRCNNVPNCMNSTLSKWLSKRAPYTRFPENLPPYIYKIPKAYKVEFLWRLNILSWQHIHTQAFLCCLPPSISAYLSRFPLLWMYAYALQEDGPTQKTGCAPPFSLYACRRVRKVYGSWLSKLETKKKGVPYVDVEWKYVCSNGFKTITRRSAVLRVWYRTG